MRRNVALPEVGRIVEMLRGRDSGTFAIVIGHDSGRFVVVVDGDRRKVDQPKRKNVLHVRKTPYFAEEVAQAIRDEGKVTNARIRHAMNEFAAKLAAASAPTKEGGTQDGEG